MAVNGFIKCIEGFTREEIRLDQMTRTCIDHIYVRDESMSLNSAIFTTKITDHYMVMVEMVNNYITSNGNQELRPDRTVKRMNEILLRRKLKECSWNYLLDIDDCDREPVPCDG